MKHVVECVFFPEESQPTDLFIPLPIIHKLLVAQQSCILYSNEQGVHVWINLLTTDIKRHGSSDWTGQIGVCRLTGKDGEEVTATQASHGQLVDYSGQ